MPPSPTERRHPGHPPPMARPMLRPGVHVVRRDDRHLQVGTRPPARVVLPDDADVRRLLAALGSAQAPATVWATHATSLRILGSAGLLVDADRFERAARDLVDHLGGPRGSAGVLEATYARHGDEAGDRLRARRAVPVGLSAPEDTAARLQRLLHTSGALTTSEPEEAGVVLVVSDGEISRHRLDPLVREGRPHLVVSGAGGVSTIGPFVVPGVTACVRCVDARLAEADPRRAVVVEQAAADPVVEARDPVLHPLTLAFAVREVLSFLEGERPASWSTSIEVDADLALERLRWARHPHCGCAWDEMSLTG